MGDAKDKKYYQEAGAKRNGARERIRKYRSYYARLLDGLDADGHTRILYGKPPTVTVRAPSDFNADDDDK